MQYGIFFYVDFGRQAVRKDGTMNITEFLARNARQYGDETCLIEINLDLQERHNVIWKEFELIENNPPESTEGKCPGAFLTRRQTAWESSPEARIGKGDKVAILLMNCLEWLPIYFGILRSGATVVPLNFRYTAMKSNIVWVFRIRPRSFSGRVYRPRGKHIRSDSRSENTSFRG
jgi:acyl-CoA synthetase (AMP-forming)/AMP-acid ligase II